MLRLIAYERRGLLIAARALELVNLEMTYKNELEDCLDWISQMYD